MSDAWHLAVQKPSEYSAMSLRVAESGESGVRGANEVEQMGGFGFVERACACLLPYVRIEAKQARLLVDLRALNHVSVDELSAEDHAADLSCETRSRAT